MTFQCPIGCKLVMIRLSPSNRSRPLCGSRHSCSAPRRLLTRGQTRDYYSHTEEVESMSRVILIIFFLAGTLSAQYTTASLGGAVRDTTGAIVSDARVTARNSDTGFTQSVNSDSTGSFLF